MNSMRDVRKYFNKKIYNCGECPRLFIEYKPGLNICSMMGFVITDFSIIYHKCPLPKTEKEVFIFDEVGVSFKKKEFETGKCLNNIIKTQR